MQRPFPEGGFLLPLIGGALKFLAPIVLPSLARKAQEVIPQVLGGAIERIGAPRPSAMEAEAEAEEPDIDAMLDAMSDEELEELAVEEGLIEPTRGAARGGAGGAMRTQVQPSVGRAITQPFRGIELGSADVRTASGIKSVAATTPTFQYPDLGLRMRTAVMER